MCGLQHLDHDLWRYRSAHVHSPVHGQRSSSWDFPMHSNVVMRCGRELASQVGARNSSRSPQSFLEGSQIGNKTPYISTAPSAPKSAVTSIWRDTKSWIRPQELAKYHNTWASIIPACCEELGYGTREIQPATLRGGRHIGAYPTISEGRADCCIWLADRLDLHHSVPGAGDSTPSS